MLREGKLEEGTVCHFMNAFPFFYLFPYTQDSLSPDFFWSEIPFFNGPLRFSFLILLNFSYPVRYLPIPPPPGEVEGRRRFHILRSWDQDGYRVAEVEWVKDVHPAEGTRERADLQELTRNAAEYAKLWMVKAKEAAQRDRRRLAELFNVESMMPPLDDSERFSFWLTTIAKRRPSERLELLRLRDTKERIARGLLYLRQEERGCRVQ